MWLRSTDLTTAVHCSGLSVLAFPEWRLRRTGIFTLPDPEKPGPKRPREEALDQHFVFRDVMHGMIIDQAFLVLCGIHQRFFADPVDHSRNAG